VVLTRGRHRTSLKIAITNASSLPASLLRSGSETIHGLLSSIKCFDNPLNASAANCGA
jgi:hypothetical protein